MKVSNINFIFSVGGDDKKNSSSWILNKWQYYFEERNWGSFFNLFQTKNIKVKELIVDPGNEISFQRHFKRSEIWLVSEGACYVAYAHKNNINEIQKIKLNKFDSYHVPAGKWHQIVNPYSKPLHIIEIQYGDECVESDIERI
jgi:mannose-1-phosphate guanylyltransferase/mannose-1-phosphate guanylyltransferase/mannose-6-phosphate isomerase